MPPQLTIRRMPKQIIADDRRVITRPFAPGNSDRILRVIERVNSLDDAQVETVLGRVFEEFAGRHRHLEKVLEEHFREVGGPCIDEPDKLSIQRRLLLGAYFTKEYSIEAAALFNPSIVPHPDQSRVPAGSLRFIMSLRATGEGHVSSLAFRTGIIGGDNQIHIHAVGRHVIPARKVKDRIYHKYTFFLKLIEMGAYNDITGAILDRLPDEFVYVRLLEAIDGTNQEEFDPQQFQETAESIRWLARSNYHLTFPEDCAVSDVVIFPVSENESCGIEDVRFVRFVGDAGEVTYIGTYTAYNGLRILPQLLETQDFHHFKIRTLNGRHAQNKGAALFPRKIDGWFTMISRVDGENLFIMPSDNITFWNEAERLQAPTFPWEFVQIGNCGSPLETEAGWLLLTHGVGPMRQYCIGATLLDIEDPRRVIAQTPEPLLVPNEREREGYVPNVVYTCGALIHNDTLFMPYAMSDAATSIACVPMDELLGYLRQCGDVTQGG